MPNLRSLAATLIVLLLAAGTTAFQTHRRRPVTDHHIKNLKPLEASTVRFRKSLNVSLLQAHIDQTSDGNSINTFEARFEDSISQLRSQFVDRRALVVAVEGVLSQALLINGFMTRNTLNKKVQNDWRSVKTNLNALANLYDLKWSWSLSVKTPSTSSRSTSLSDVDLDKLINSLEIDVGKFRTSMTEAFWKSPYDRTRAEGMINDALLGLKKAIDQMRFQFDSRQSIDSIVGQVLMQAAPIEKFMRGNPVTEGAQSDWSILRDDLKVLADSYKLSSN